MSRAETTEAGWNGTMEHDLRILLTGKNGQVGFELRRALAVLGEVRAIDQTECNLGDPQKIRHLIREYRPAIVINSAAYTAVDKAETEPEVAFAVNTRAPEVMAEEANRLGALMVHYCTDYVYDGQKTGVYTEHDIPHPLSVYGKTKAEGTMALCRQTDRHLILRTSWVFGAHGHNFVKTMLRLGREREELKVVADQFGAPTSAALLADVTAQIIGQYQRHLNKSAFPYGLYHCSASGETTWYDFAKTVITFARQYGVEMKVAPERIVAITSAEYPLPAPRPANSRFSTEALERTFGLRLPLWQNGLEHVLQQLLGV